MNLPEQWTRQAVAERLKDLFADEAPPPGAAFIAAAAVLATFDPDRLQPHGPQPEDLEAARTGLLERSEQVTTSDGRTRWVLTREARREALRRLIADREIAAALSANPDRERDDMQQMLESVLSNPSYVPALTQPQQVRAYQIVADWLARLMPGVPDPRTLRPLADRAAQLAPFRQLVGEYFAGRAGELAKLGDYVGILGPSGALEAATRVLRSVFSIVEEPPLFVFGPGGIGKSTLVAKFILDHVDNPRVPQFPYAYLDLDRPGLVAEEPITLLIEALRQLAMQYPESRERLTSLQREWAAKIASTAPPPRKTPTPERVRSPEPSSAPGRGRERETEAKIDVKRFEAIWSRMRLGERDYYIESFAHAVRALQPGAQPMLLVLDTFEEVQLRSAAHVSEVFAFLDQLQRHIPFLRTVLCGRVAPFGYTVRELEIPSFDLEAAVAYLTARVRIDRQTAETVARQVTGSPLTLKLAADLLRKEQSVPGGLSNLDEVLGKLKKGSIEAQLYTRVLRHILDPEVRKLAHPGLVLRRITPEIIQEVLAGPCGLAVPDGDEAKRLFKKLRSEVVLVSEQSQEVLIHRPELRAVMLGPLREDEPDRVEQIHKAAVRYYETQSPDPEMRAEEIYHRLSIEFDRAALERRWMGGMDRFLAHALPELSSRAQGFLAARLNLTLDAAVWVQVDVEDWERYAIRELREYLRVGRLDAALALLQQRKDFSSVDLRLLYAETLARTGNVAAARASALETLAMVPPDSEAARTLQELLGAAKGSGAPSSNAGAADSSRPTGASSGQHGASRPHQPADVRALGEALADAFSRVDDLFELLDNLGLHEVMSRLPDVTSLPESRGVATLALAIAAQAVSANWLASLVLFARRSKPDNARLWSVADTLGLLARGCSDVSAIQQSILRDHRPGDLRAALTRLEAQTCFISSGPPSESVTSGFLVGPDLVMTSSSILGNPGLTGAAPSIDAAIGQALFATFDTWATDTGVTMPGVQVPFAHEWLAAFSVSSESGGDGLGYALLRLANPIGNSPGADRGRRGWMALRPQPAVSKGAVATLRFDSRRALYFSMSPTRMHGMRDRDDRRRRLRYDIDGEPGGSGNPVFDEQLQVVALHVVRTDSWLGSITRRNLLGEGLPVDLIVRDLASRGIVLTPPDAAGVSFSA